jgi:hypothetical protein
MTDSSAHAPPDSMTRFAWLGFAALCIAAGAGASLALGQDVNWDLLNYHLYNPWAVLEGRFGIDHHPGGEQTFLNPALDLLLYPLLTAVPDYVGGALLGAFQGLAFFALFVLAREAFGANRQALPLAALATVGGATSAMTIAEIGTTFGDLTTAVAVIAALALALRAYTRPDARRLPWRLGIAGLLLGVATGFKLTNALFALAFVVAVALIPPGGRLRSLAWLLAPAALGLVALHGPWSAFLASNYGNPIFPFANRWFESPSYSVANFTGPRYFPESWGETVLFPFFFPFNNRTSEVPFRDFRLAAAYLAVIVLGAMMFARARLQRPWPAFVPHARASEFLMVFVAIAYAAWLAIFSIQRYLVVLDLLAPLVCLLFIAHFFARGVERLVAGAVMVVALVATTMPGDWGRIAWEGGPYSRLYNFAAPPPGSAVIIGTRPLAFLAPASAAPGVVWVGPRFNEHDRDELERKIAGRKLFIAILPGAYTDKDVARSLIRFRLKPDGMCTALWARIVGLVSLCPVTRGAGTDIDARVNDSSAWSFELAAKVPAISLKPGESAWIPFRIRHTGQRPVWAALHETRRIAGLPERTGAGDDVAVAYHLTRENGEMVLFEGVRTPLPRSLAPGEGYDLMLRVAAPPQPGTYLVKPDVFHMGVAWMDGRATGTPLVLTVR